MQQSHYEVKDYGKFALTEAENSEIWNLIQPQKFNSLEYSDKPQGDCDTQYLFTLKGEIGTHSISIDSREAKNNKYILDLVSRMRELIRKYTGVEPKIA